MSSITSISIASRKSALARYQAFEVGEEIQKRYPHVNIKYHFRSSLGDQNAADPLWKMPEKGVFTEDFYEGLSRKQWDMVVHSWKDLPIEDKELTEVVATLPRADVRDVLLYKKDSVKPGEDFVIYSSSPRRQHNLSEYLRPYLAVDVRSLKFENVRGNIQTRVKKLYQNDGVQGLVVAKAALDRLLEQRFEDLDEETAEFRNHFKTLDFMVLPLSFNPTAAAQGAIAIEINKENHELRALLEELNCESTFRSVQKERKTMKKWGGGCHQKIGLTVLHRDYGELTFAKGLTESGEAISVWELKPFEQENHSSDSLQNANKVHREKGPKWETCFPHEPRQQVWFRRTYREGSKSSNNKINEYKEFNAHYVTRELAVPKSTSFKVEDVIWASGLETWKKLARRGIWVNGCSESLGEREDERLDVLKSNLKWCKWTHSEGLVEGQKERLVTYDLKPVENKPKLSEEMSDFYWMSGSSFKEALKLYPWLVNRNHWCGPGHSLQQIRKTIEKLGGSGIVDIAFSFKKWKTQIQGPQDPTQKE